VADLSSVKSALDGLMFDAIVHLASVNEGNAPNYPERALQINAFGTRNLLQWVQDTGQAKSTHFIYFSTFHAYGLNHGVITEDTPLLPKHDYGLTHLFAEYYVRQFWATCGINYTTFRLTNSYGSPLEIGSSKWYLVLNDLCLSAAKTGVVKLGSNGQPVRDFVWMGDVCQVVKASILQGPANDVFNLGGGHTYSMLDVAGYVAEAYQSLGWGEALVQVNEADTNQYDNTLSVSIAKLQACIPTYQPANHLLDEAKATILLASQL
jgi:nucleoside-diphosphate-sugar epimerase